MSTPHVHLSRAVAVVAQHVGLDADRITNPSGWHEKRARRTALYLAVVVGGVGIRQVARAAAVHHRCLQHAFVAIEDSRDNPKIDTELSALEEAYQCAT